MKLSAVFVAVAALVSQAAAHCKLPSDSLRDWRVLMDVTPSDTFPSLVVDGTTTPAWVNVRLTNNYETQAPVTNVSSPDLRCYDSAEPGTATTISVAAGSQLGIMSDGTIYHPGVSAY